MILILPGHLEHQCQWLVQNTTGIRSGTGPALTLQVTGIVLPWGITTFCLLSLTVPKSSGRV